MQRVSLELSFEDGEWIARGKGLTLRAPSFPSLVENLKEVLPHQGLKGKVKVLLHYDLRNLPQWLWQYHSYYFSREIEI